VRDLAVTCEPLHRVINDSLGVRSQVGISPVPSLKHPPRGMGFQERDEMIEYL